MPRGDGARAYSDPGPRGPGWSAKECQAPSPRLIPEWSLEEALAEAHSVIEEMAGSVGTGASGATWTLVVRNAAGSVVGRIPIRA